MSTLVSYFLNLQFWYAKRMMSWEDIKPMDWTDWIKWYKRGFFVIFLLYSFFFLMCKFAVISLCNFVPLQNLQALWWVSLWAVTLSSEFLQTSHFHTLDTDLQKLLTFNQSWNMIIPKFLKVIFKPPIRSKAVKK